MAQSLQDNMFNGHKSHNTKNVVSSKIWMLLFKDTWMSLYSPAMITLLEGKSYHADSVQTKYYNI